MTAWASSAVNVLAGVCVLPALPGTGTGKAEVSYRLVIEPQAGYRFIYRAISEAKRSVDMTMYLLSDAKAEQALIADAKSGVDVRVLLDSNPAGGGGRAANEVAYSSLKAGGVDVEWAWPGTLWHQKSVVVDSSTAIVMTCNLYAPYYPVLRDFAVITTNPATVSGIGATFSADFTTTSRPPTEGSVPKGSGLIWSPGAQPGLVELIGSARRGTTLYAEDEQLDSTPIEEALVAAAKRGVAVDLTMTYSPSYLSGFNALASGGVHVRLYKPGASIYIHAKAVSVNDSTVYVGSSNFTTPMTNQNRNVGIITTAPAVVRGVTATMAEDFNRAAPYSSA